LQRKIQIKNAVFIQAFNKLKEVGFYDNFAKTLNLKPKTTCIAKAAAAGEKNPVKKQPSINNGKTSVRAAAGSVSLSAGK